MSTEFWIIVLTLGYIFMAWVMILLLTATKDWRGDEDGAQYALGALWPIALIYYSVKCLGLSANALGERVKANRRMVR